MFHGSLSKKVVAAGAAAAVALGAAACGSSSNATTTASGKKLTTVTMMVGGIDKQIYLPYQLGYDLGFFKKYGINMVLSTESNGGVGAETAMASGQVDLAGAWYNHTLEFQQAGKSVIDLAQLSGAPGEREMCAMNSGVKTPADWKGKSVGVTDPGSGTDDLTIYLAARYHLPTNQFNRAGVGAGETLLASLQHKTTVCSMTSQPTVNALEQKKIAYSAIDLATTAGVNHWLGGAYPAAGVLGLQSWVNSHKVAAQEVVDAMVATMHWIASHRAADVADHMPPQFVSSGLSTRADYISALAKDKGQFLPDGIMPANGPSTVLAIEKLTGKITRPVDLPATYTNSYVNIANKLEGFTK